MQTYLTKNNGKLPVGATYGSNPNERTIFTTEKSLANATSNSTEVVIVNPNSLDLQLSEGTHLRIYDRYPATNVGFDQGTYYVQGWNYDGKDFIHYDSRVYFDPTAGKLKCAGRINNDC